jgi:Abnormal spindle-like microcephaly-assoc'd, ASPM-SPD-2-Hydin
MHSYEKHITLPLFSFCSASYPCSFCTFQEVMFVSSNILFVPSPARLSQYLLALLTVTFESRTSSTPGPTTRPRGFDGLWTAFVLAAVCCLMDPSAKAMAQAPPPNGQRGAQLTVSASSLSFGSETVNTAKTMTLTLSSTGTSAATVSSAAITGAGFTIVGGSFPATLNPNQTLALQVQFKPTTAGAVTGQLAISSNSTTGGTADVALSGTGTAVAHSVDLSWTAPSGSADPVAGYNIYRAISGGSLALVNSSMDSSTTYVDSTVVSGTTYNYVVKSVDSSGAESVASNEITVAIP